MRRTRAESPLASSTLGPRTKQPGRPASTGNHSLNRACPLLCSSALATPADRSVGGRVPANSWAAVHQPQGLGKRGTQRPPASCRSHQAGVVCSWIFFFFPRGGFFSPLAHDARADCWPPADVSWPIPTAASASHEPGAGPGGPVRGSWSSWPGGRGGWRWRPRVTRASAERNRRRGAAAIRPWCVRHQPLMPLIDQAVKPHQ